jgi:hypothetical protein
MEFFGFGGRPMGRAGAGLALSEGTESVLSDPAALPGITHPELSVGFLLADTAFAQFGDLWWDSNQDGRIDETDPGLDAGPDYDAVHGVMLGATRPLGKRAAMGIALFIPKERLLRLQTFDPSIPTYFLYANRTQRYELGAGIAVRPIAGISAGLGVQMVPRARYSIDGTLNIGVSGATAEDSEASDVVALGMDVHEMSLDLVPGFSPNVSLQWQAGQAIPALEGLSVAAAWRGEAGLPVDVDINLQVNTTASDIGSVEAITLPVALAMQLGVFDHYVPSELNFGASYTFKQRLTVSADLRRTAWDQMQLSIARVTHSSVQGAAVDFGEDPIEDGNPYTVQLAATWAPRIGADVHLPPIHTRTRLQDLKLTARAGVGFEPSPLVAQSAQSALLDSDRLILAIGAGLAHSDPFRNPAHPEAARPMRVDGFFQYHLLATGEYDRPAPDVPTAGYTVDGAPIPVGGHLLAAGLQWSFEY